MMDQVVFYLLVTFCSVLPAEQQTIPFSFSYIGMGMMVEKSDQRCVFQNPNFPDHMLDVVLNGEGNATFSDRSMIEDIDFSISVDGNGEVYNFSDHQINVTRASSGIDLLLIKSGQVGLSTSRL